MEEIKLKGKIHLVGIGGISMSALAQYFLTEGFEVSGSDVRENEQTMLLRGLGAEIHIGHDVSNIDKGTVGLCIFTSAVKEDNVELDYCRQNSIPVVRREQALGDIFDDYPFGVAVCGSHGKTTTTGMLAHILDGLQKNPAVFIGGVLKRSGSNFEKGGGEYCISEACEYRESFKYLHPYVSVLLNIELDHTDYFRSLRHVKDSFVAFTQNTRPDGCVVLNADGIDAFTRARIKGRKITFGLKRGCDVRAVKLVQTNGNFSFDVKAEGNTVGHVDLKVAGRHNVYNALAAVAACFCLGLDMPTVCMLLSGFAGVSRRYETFDCGYTNIVADYAHHPSEIKALLDAVKLKSFDNIYMVFQPHTYSRTKGLFDRFVYCFSGVKKLWILPIYAAREKPIENVSGKTLAAAVDRVTPCEYVEDFAAAKKKIRETADKNDIVLIVGAGDVIDMCDDELLKPLG